MARASRKWDKGRWAQFRKDTLEGIHAESSFRQWLRSGQEEPMLFEQLRERELFQAAIDTGQTEVKTDNCKHWFEHKDRIVEMVKRLDDRIARMRALGY